MQYYVGMSTLCAVELAGAVDAMLSLADQMEVTYIPGLDYYSIHVLFCLACLTMLFFLRTFTSHGFRHALGTIILVIFFIAIACCCGGVLAGLAGAWLPPPLNEKGTYHKPSFANLKLNLGVSEVDMDDIRVVLSFVYPSFIGIFQGANLVCL